MGRTPMRTIVLVLLLLLLGLCGQAGAWCLQPDDTPPHCIDQSEKKEFKSEEDYDACRAEVERYVKRMQDWSRCVREESLTRSNEVIEKFNCKVRGEFCP